MRTATEQKPYRLIWIEAERALALRGIAVPATTLKGNQSTQPAHIPARPSPIREQVR